MSDPTLDRREFLRRLGLRAGASAIPLTFPACRQRSTTDARQARTLHPHEWAVIEEATSRLVPTDDLPGAREANVVGFIDAELAHPSFAVFRREVRRGVRVLDELARARFGATFDEIEPAGRDAVLSAIQAGEGSRGTLRTAHFFQVLFTFTIEGLLSDPVHGGNASEVGWRIIGYTPSGPRPGGSHA
jgi:gluconate 2-dehydrogenase gamma chain